MNRRTEGPRDDQAGDPDGLSPRDRWITVYGRKPVMEALHDPALTVAKVVVADNARGDSLEHILSVADQQGIPVERSSATRVKWLAGNGKQDQGVVADVDAPRMTPLTQFVRDRANRPTTVFLLDGVTNPANVGMILRTATGAGVDGVVLPRAGTPHVGPLVIKASAGVAFQAPIVNAPTADGAVDTFREAGYTVYGLAARSELSLFLTELAPRAVFVLGGETNGLSVRTDTDLRIPLLNGVESLNVAVAAAVLAFELANRA